MPLNELVVDPEPTDEEIAPYLIEARLIPEAETAWPGVTRRFASLLWMVAKKKENPDLFLVPFADGIENYPAYIRSQKWLSIRERVLQASFGKCRCCGRRATQVHHRDYRPRVIEGDDLDALVAICGPCHEHVEGVKKDRSWNEAERLLASLVLEQERKTN